MYDSSIEVISIYVHQANVEIRRNGCRLMLH